MDQGGKLFSRVFFLRSFFNKNYMLFWLSFFYLSPLAQARLDMSLESSSYITPTDLKGQLDHYIDVGIGFKSQRYFDTWFYGMEFTSLFSLDKSDQKYLDVPDLFIGYKWSNALNGYNFNFVIGRQKRLNNMEIREEDKDSPPPSVESWSFMDEIWDLGLWQGRTNWDYLHPGQLGLIGSFFTVSKNQWLMTLFLSGLFLPEQGPAVDIKNGIISSGSRWFVAPQSEFVFFSQRFEALYWAKRPYLKDVVLNDSVAFRFRFGKKEDQWFGLAYAYKPVNQIFFKIDGGFSINKKAVDSYIYYQSFKHSLISIDFGMRKSVFNTVFSVTGEVPRRPKLPENWIVPVLPDTLFFSSHIEMDLKKYHLLLKSLTFNFLYSRVIEEDQSARKEGQLELDLNINRFKLHRGFSLSAYSKEFALGNHLLSINVGYWYSIPEKGGWLHTSVRWRINPNIILESKLDILGAESDTTKDDFFKLYSQNDRVQFKVVYVIKN